ncbi:MAG: hypothetical protein IT435_12115 [Phycisphaerales bacterium]|nr:hypothetical protein [Phycisphaerales bacterium]
MGISFEELLGSMGRWLDRVGGEIGWRWRARSMSGGLGSGRLREYFETASDWLTEKWRALMWWMQVRGINTDRLIPAGPVSWKRIAR